MREQRRVVVAESLRVCSFTLKRYFYHRPSAHLTPMSILHPREIVCVLWTKPLFPTRLHPAHLAFVPILDPREVVCVIYTKPLFLPVDTQHIKRPCRFLTLEKLRVLFILNR